MMLARVFMMVVAVTALCACQPAATSTPEARAPLATRAPVSGGPVAPTAEPIDTAEPIATIGSTTGDWQTFSSAEGGFTLLLPAEPKEQKQPISTDAGTVDAIMYIAEVGSGAYGVGYSDFPGDASRVNAEDVLAGARDGAARNVNGTVVSEKPIELDGHPGLEIAIELPESSTMPGGAMYRARLYLVGNRLYQVIYVALKDDDSPAEYEKLFDSFQLDNPPTSESSSLPANPALSGWVEYRSDDGNFTVLFPTDPQVQTQLADTAAGAVQITMAMAELDDHAAGVSFNEIPQGAAADPETVLEGGRVGAAENLNGTVVSNKPITLGDYPGTEFVVEAPDNIIYTARVYVVNDRLYQVLFITTKDKLDQFDVQAFFDSFTLLEQ